MKKKKQIKENWNRIATNFFQCNVCLHSHFYVWLCWKFFFLSTEYREQCLIVKQTVRSVTHWEKKMKHHKYVDSMFCSDFFYFASSFYFFVSAIWWFKRRCTSAKTVSFVLFIRDGEKKIAFVRTLLLPFLIVLSHELCTLHWITLL